MDKKWLPLTITLGVAGVAVVTASVWPDNVEKPPLPQSLCHGALSRETAELIDDGQGGEISTDEWESKGESTDYAVFKACRVLRANPYDDNDNPRGVYKLAIEDTPSPPGRKKGSTSLGSGLVGWALPERATVTLPRRLPRPHGLDRPVHQGVARRALAGRGEAGPAGEEAACRRGHRAAQQRDRDAGSGHQAR